MSCLIIAFVFIGIVEKSFNDEITYCRSNGRSCSSCGCFLLFYNTGVGVYSSTPRCLDSGRRRGLDGLAVDEKSVGWATAKCPDDWCNRHILYVGRCPISNHV